MWKKIRNPKGRFAIFKKKKEKKEVVEDKGIEDSSDIVEAKDSGETKTTGKWALNIDLKNILAVAVTAVISVGCAFIFVTRIYNSNDVYDVTNVADASTVGDTGNTPKENTEVNPEKKEAKKVKSESKKEEGNTGNGGRSSDILGKILVPMDSIVVNLGKIDSRRYLRVIISLEVDSIETEEAVKENKVVFRDKLISFLSTKNPKEIETQAGQFKLRTEIKDILNKDLFGADDAVTQVYFSDLIIQ